MEAYFDAKARLFTPELSERGVVDVDTEEGRRLAQRASVPVVTVGFREPGADIVATDVEIGPGGISFRISGLTIRSYLRGPYNVSNCLAACVAARQLGVPDDALAEGVAALAGGARPPRAGGRRAGVLGAGRLRAHARQPGERPAGHAPARRGTQADRRLRLRRRPRPRQAAADGRGGNAPRRPHGRHLRQSALRGSRSRSSPTSSRAPRRGGGSYSVEPDRRRAIAMALAEAAPGDVVVIAGKGHETGQQFADRTVPFDDRVVAREELASLAAGGGERPTGGAP